jgi:hypothetical protein
MLKDIKTIRKNLAEYKRWGFKINLIKYITSSKYRAGLFKRRGEYWKLKAKHVGYLMTENTPGAMFNEVLIDRIYDVGGGSNLKRMISLLTSVLITETAQYGGPRNSRPM